MKRRVSFYVERALIILVTVLVIMMVAIALIRIPVLTKTSQFWRATAGQGVRFDFGTYIDSIDGEFEIDETLGNPKEGYQYSIMHFGVNNLEGEIGTCYIEGEVKATWMRAYAGDQLRYDFEDLAEDLAKTPAQVASLEGDVVMTREMFEKFVQITSNAKDEKEG